MAQNSGLVFIRKAELQKLISGPMFRYLTQVATQLQLGAKRRAPVSQPDRVPKRRRPRRPPGELRKAITKRFITVNGQRAIAVGVFSGPAAKYAYFVHEGTRPHPITARARSNRGKGRAGVLAFYWPKAGNIVYFKRVHHPGTKPNRFLTDEAKAMGLKVRTARTGR